MPKSRFKYKPQVYIYKSQEIIQLESLVKSITTCVADITAHLATINFKNIGIDKLPDYIQRSITKLNITKLKENPKAKHSFFCCSKKTMSVANVLEILDAEFKKHDSKLKAISTDREYKAFVDNSVNIPLSKSGECTIM